MTRFFLASPALAALALFIAACGGNAVIPSPAVPGYPCGVMGVYCGSDAKGALCCDRGEECGRKGTASEGACPYVGDDTPVFGMHTQPLKMQWRPQ